MNHTHKPVCLQVKTNWPDQVKTTRPGIGNFWFHIWSSLASIFTQPRKFNQCTDIPVSPQVWTKCWPRPSWGGPPSPGPETSRGSSSIPCQLGICRASWGWIISLDYISRPGYISKVIMRGRYKTSRGKMPSLPFVLISQKSHLSGWIWKYQLSIVSKLLWKTLVKHCHYSKKG